MKDNKSLKIKLIAGLLVFLMMFTNCAPLGAMLVSLAADNNAEKMNFSVRFTTITEQTQKTDDSENSEPTNDENNNQVPENSEETERNNNDNNNDNSEENENSNNEQNEENNDWMNESSRGDLNNELNGELESNGVTQENGESESNEPEQGENENPEFNEPEQGENGDSEFNEPEQGENGNSEFNEPEQGENGDSEFNEPEQGENENPEFNEPEQSGNENSENNEANNETKPNESEESGNNVVQIEETPALELTLSVREGGYLKNAKVEIKNLANQLFTIKEQQILDQYIQSIDNNKIKLVQVKGGNEIKAYIPIELKNEESIDIATLQAGTTVAISATYVDEEGIEEILTKEATAVIGIENNVDLAVESTIEKYIPYVNNEVNNALVQLKLTAYSRNTKELPVKDSSYEIEIPQIDGVSIENLNVSAMNTAYTNGLISNDVVFTLENWEYKDGKVIIGIDNVVKDGRYQKGAGKDEFIISFTYVNCPEQMGEAVLKSSIKATSNVFTSTGTKEIGTTAEQEYNLSQASSELVKYDLIGKSEEVSKGYLYANANTENPEYELEFENAFGVNISRVDLVQSVEIRETAEYFQDDNGNMYNGNNYYKTIRLNKENLLSIIGETGNFELLQEDGSFLIQINKDTEDDGDGYITITFGDNKINKVIMKLNGPINEGILNIATKKAITKAEYNKIDLSTFRTLNNEYTGYALLQEGITTEMGQKKTTVNLLDTLTNATVSLNRNELSTLAKNEDIEINISLNNTTIMSDMYNNPVFELTFPEEVTDVSIKDINLVYGNDELNISNVEVLRNNLNNVVLRVTLEGAQSRCILGDLDQGTIIIIKTDIDVDMYKASRNTRLVLNYYNNDATNYFLDSDWNILQSPSENMLTTKQGINDTELKIVAPDGLVNAQMISGYRGENTVTSINQGRKKDIIDPYTEAKIAEMKMMVINNSKENMDDVYVLGRTMFAGNQTISDGTDLETNIDAPMVSEIIPTAGEHSYSIYYSENENAMEDLNNPENGWMVSPEDFTKVKSYLIVVDGTVQVGEILMFTYNFEIPANLENNLNCSGTFGTYYVGDERSGFKEADKVMLTTGDAPKFNMNVTTNTQTKYVQNEQIIKYTVTVKNEGKTVANNTIVNCTIPVGTTYIEYVQNMNPTMGVIGELIPQPVPEKEKIEFNVGSIPVGTEKQISYDVIVNYNAEINSNIQGSYSVIADGLKEPTTTMSEVLVVEPSEMEIKITEDTIEDWVKEGERIKFSTTVLMKQNIDVQNCVLKVNLPPEVEYVDSYLNTDSGERGTYNSGTNTVIWNLQNVNNFVTAIVIVKAKVIEQTEKEVVFFTTVSGDNLSKEYVSSQLKKRIIKPLIDVNYYSTNENMYMKEGEKVQYILEVSNRSTVLSELELQSMLPSELRILSAQRIQGGVTNTIVASKNVKTKVIVHPNETAKIVLDCMVGNIGNSETERIIQNNWSITGVGLQVNTSAVGNIIQQNPNINNPKEYSNQSTAPNNEMRIPENLPNGLPQEKPEESLAYVEVPEENQEKEPEEVRTYRILGKAFEDINHNGQRDDDEGVIENIVAKLCNASSQEIVAQTITNSVGEYLFENVVPGEYYVKFEYDSDKYELTDYKKDGVNPDRNSDAIIANYKAITDKIKVVDSSLSNIDIGLIRAGIFDLDLDVNINKVIVQNDDETKTYEMENSKLAKVDLNPKYANSSTVYVEYTISVSNRGEIAGYAKRIVDYLPEELTLDTTMNPDWYVGQNNNIYTNALDSILILPGETKELKLVLTQQVTEDATGIINNTFEIAQSYNEWAISDIDSTAGNKVDGEDDMSSCDIIIGIQTGGTFINLMLITTTFITFLVVLYVIKVYIDKKNKGVIA